MLIMYLIPLWASAAQAQATPISASPECKDGSFIKPVGWSGSGKGASYCKLWHCEAKSKTFVKELGSCITTKASKAGEFECSHTSCFFGCTRLSSSHEVLTVKHDHLETFGGHHACGFDKYSAHCICKCYGNRRQDVLGFRRTLIHTGKGKRKMPPKTLEMCSETKIQDKNWNSDPDRSTRVTLLDTSHCFTSTTVVRELKYYTRLNKPWRYPGWSRCFATKWEAPRCDFGASADGAHPLCTFPLPDSFVNQGSHSAPLRLWQPWLR